METILVVLHYLICFFLIVAILLQVGKGADIGAVFGGASQTVFGGRGPTTFLNKITAGVAMAFLVTSITLAHISKTRSAETVMDKAAPVGTEVQPAATPDAGKPEGDKAEAAKEVAPEVKVGEEKTVVAPKPEATKAADDKAGTKKEKKK